MENWTASEWIKAIFFVLVILWALRKFVFGRIQSKNLRAIKVLLVMLEEDRKEFCREELDGVAISDDIKLQFEALKQSASDLYQINKRDKNSIRVHKHIEQYHAQMVNLELAAMKECEFKTYPHGRVVRHIA